MGYQAGSAHHIDAFQERVAKDIVSQAHASLDPAKDETSVVVEPVAQVFFLDDDLGLTDSNANCWHISSSGVGWKVPGSLCCFVPGTGNCRVNLRYQVVIDEHDGGASIGDGSVSG